MCVSELSGTASTDAFSSNVLLHAWYANVLIILAVYKSLTKCTKKKCLKSFHAAYLDVHMQWFDT